jgi:hypothetical protein
MTSDDDSAQCFLVEWYQSGPAALEARDAAAQLTRAARTASTRTQPVVLVMALTVPHDRTLFGVFCAHSADAVIHTCQHAGWPADRISTDVHPWLPPPPH